MKKFLLDTNICIHYLKGEYNIAERIEKLQIENWIDDES